MALPKFGIEWDKMQIPIISGMYVDGAGDFRASYPVNYIPVIEKQGISNGFSRPSDGIVLFGSVSTGFDRGGINWNGICYRVIGTTLYRVNSDGTTISMGAISGTGLVRFDYSFDRLGIAADGKLWYLTGTTLQQVTDTDLGTVVDMCWVDGYFMTTDGEFLIVTELNDPFAVNPLKYGSSEVDPDPVECLLKLKGEIYALNRYTIEVFENVGGDLFPFQRIDGGLIQKGIIGTRAACIFNDAIAFVGGGRNEGLGVYLGLNGQTTKISTRDIDILLTSYTEVELSSILVETRVGTGYEHLLIHLPDRTVVFEGIASKAVGEPIWFILTSALIGFEQYRARNLVYCYNKWLVGDTKTSNIGCLTNAISTHYGDAIRWEINAGIVYNEGRGAIFHQLELVGLTGNLVSEGDAYIATSYSLDGRSWSMEKPINAGKYGDRTKRLIWLQQGNMRNWRIQRFSGDSNTHISFARLEALLEPLAI
jgi:hypothetical protein